MRQLLQFSWFLTPNLTDQVAPFRNTGGQDRMISLVEVAVAKIFTSEAVSLYALPCFQSSELYLTLKRQP